MSGRLTEVSSAEEVEFCDELITHIFSWMPTRELVKMSTIQKRWRTLILEPAFALTQHKNCPPESIYLVHEEAELLHYMHHEFLFLSYNPQTRKLSTLSFSLESIPYNYLNASTCLVAASHGLLCFCYSLGEGTPGFVMYNPVTKIFRNLPPPPTAPDLIIPSPWLVAICSPYNNGKLVIVGKCTHHEEATITLVYDSQSNSWYKGPPPKQYHLSTSSHTGHPLYLNGVIYFLVRTTYRVDQGEKDPVEGEHFFEDEFGLYYKIIGYDVDQDQWCFSIFLPRSVGFPYCLIEWKGNLLVLAANSTQEENLFVLGPSSSHGNRNQQIMYTNNEGDGRFVIWMLDRVRKLWTREQDLDLLDHTRASWLVAGSGGVLWLQKSYNCVIVYHIKQGRWTNHQIHGQSYTTPYLEINASPSWLKFTEKLYVAFEPTLLSF